MDLSVVICTRNRAHYLPKMLESLQRLQAPGIHWELILIDNNSSDETLRILEQFRLDFPIPTQVIHEPKDGLSNARNTGWKAASGKIISFTDDDCYPQEDWLPNIVDAFIKRSVSSPAWNGVPAPRRLSKPPIVSNTSRRNAKFAPMTCPDSTCVFAGKCRAWVEVWIVIGASSGSNNRTRPPI